MSNINTILYCNEELPEDPNEDQSLRADNYNPILKCAISFLLMTIRLYNHHSSLSCPFSDCLMEIRINRFTEGEFTLIANLNPIFCYM